MFNLKNRHIEKGIAVTYAKIHNICGYYKWDDGYVSLETPFFKAFLARAAISDPYISGYLTLRTVVLCSMFGSNHKLSEKDCAALFQGAENKIYGDYAHDVTQAQLTFAKEASAAYLLGANRGSQIMLINMTADKTNKDYSDALQSVEISKALYNNNLISINELDNYSSESQFIFSTMERKWFNSYLDAFKESIQRTSLP